MFSIYSHQSPFCQDNEYFSKDLAPGPRKYALDNFLSIDTSKEYSPLSPKSTSPLSQTSSVLGSSYTNSSTYSSTGCTAPSSINAKKSNYRQLAHKLEQDPRLFTTILHQVLPNFNAIAVDPAGNYLCQALVEQASTQQLGSMLFKMTSNWIGIVNHPHGTRVAQRMAEFLTDSSQYKSFVENCMNHLGQMMRHNNGNHVLRKVVQHFPFNYSSCIYQAFLENLDTFSKDKYGVCVIQNALDTASEQTRQVFYQHLKPRAMNMITDKFANYLVQYVLDKATKPIVEEWIMMFVPELHRLCQDQCASNVIEKAIKYSSPMLRNILIDELKQSANELALDPFGNYVLQTSLEYANRNSFITMSNVLLNSENELKMTPFVIQINLG
eukprot:NODE_11_length_46995_cov_0.451872.p12 type:complete len:383 gc:universal NODE_11_length_46995_cov_0.451872:1654-506(-)